jgi:bifunctional non-homologous end joining protein LigD
MNITEFVISNANVKPNSDIVERWQGRVVAGALHTAGAAGAEAYLGQYGKGIKAPKAVALARCAEINGFPQFAARMWEEAFFLTTGNRSRLATNAAEGPAPEQSPVRLKEAFGQRPQLLVAIEETEVERYLSDDRYGMQEKKDGRRTLVRNGNKVLSAGNKKGLDTGVPLVLVSGIGGLGLPDFLSDGEDTPREAIYHAFDLLEYAGDDLRTLGVGRRHGLLVEQLSYLESKTDSFRIIPMVRGGDAKRALFAMLRRTGAEGVVFKLLDAPYESGDKHGTQVKFQFRGLGAFIVGKRNGMKNSVEIFVHKSTGGLRAMGRLTIPANATLPSPGAILEVEYLYCHTGPDGELAQPVFKEARTDVSPEDCQEDKLKVRGVAEDE